MARTLEVNLAIAKLAEQAAIAHSQRTPEQRAREEHQRDLLIIAGNNVYREQERYANSDNTRYIG